MFWRFVPSAASAFKHSLARIRHTRSPFFGSAPRHPARKEGDNPEQIGNQFFGGRLRLGWFYHFSSYLSQTKGLFEIAKAHQTIRIVDQDQLNLLVINEVKESFQAFALFVETRCRSWISATT
ncbi:MAG TPA: hypothetical protein VF844_11980 [Ktedonobacteraceae bacterium]